MAAEIIRSRKSYKQYFYLIAIAEWLLRIGFSSKKNKKCNQFVPIGFRLDNGQYFAEIGTLKNVDGRRVTVVSGEYGYRDDDDRIHVIKYAADENGFQQTETETKYGTQHLDELLTEVLSIDPNALKSLIGWYYHYCYIFVNTFKWMKWSIKIN